MMHIIRYTAGCMPLIVLLLCALASVASAADVPPRSLPASHRALPTLWQARDFIGAPACGPDGNIYFLVSGRSVRLARFVPATQQFELLFDLGTLATGRAAGRSVNARAPLAIDRDGLVWIGTQSLQRDAGGRGARLIAFSPKTRAVTHQTELEDRSIIGLDLDRERGHLLALASGQRDTRLLRYAIREAAWTDLGLVGGVWPRTATVTVLPDGRAVLLGDGDVFYLYDPAAATLRRTAATLPEQSDGACALTAAPNGTGIYGITRATGLLFMFDPAAETVTHLGPVFGERLPGTVAIRENRMALCAGADGVLYYAGSEAEGNRGLVGSYHPAAGTWAAKGALASPVRRLAPPHAIYACADGDRRIYLAGTGAPGIGLYAFPPLPEPIPWSTTDRTYHCRRVADRDIVIDGNLGDAGWRQVTPLDNFQSGLYTSRPGTPRFATTAYLAWSNTRLYYAFRCAIDTIKAVGTERDSDVWAGECAEVFLCPQGADAPYYEIDVNPHGVLFDSHPQSYCWSELGPQLGEWKRAWNPQIAVNAVIERDAEGRVTGWIVEAAIPFAAIDGGAPRAGDTWLFNMMRIAHPAQGGEEYQAWHPTYVNFHQPHQFPKLRFER